MMQDLERVLFSQEALGEITARLGAQISADYAGRELLLVGVLRGCVPFFADLMRQITVPCRTDFLELSSYGDGTESSGTVQLRKDLHEPVEHRDVLIVEDLLDSGRTLQYIRELFQTRGAASVRVCVLLDKPQAHPPELSADYVGAQAPPEFLVGYGMDYAQRYRNLPVVGVLKPEVYQAKGAAQPNCTV